ncbi:VWA domain-containing protein [Luteimonas terrae]|uniref:Ca-activated chloride channel family protein n=1 Tax=Luteimonas terrae TaxID=1530191 RepID=A0ABU1XUF4_9GAMM|nr:VWA domain-containing protein [Luteimonas terrae]MDR7192208.1 Ca-activated chloride channel family protein [Luteimonas terrae]
MSLSLDALQFARPGWLWALLLLPALGWIWWRRRRSVDAWREAVDPHLLAHLLEARPDRRGLLGLAAWLLAGLLAVLALAGPGWREVAVPLDTQGMAPLVVAIDLSTASTASDLPPSRLLQARAKLSQLLAERGGGQIALVAYADDAFTVAPLTADARNVALYLDALSPEIMPVDGHRADRAITQATRLLRQGQALRGDILLLTGDADTAAVAEAGIAARMGYRVSVLGLGTTAGAAYRNADGGLAHARLDPVALRALAVAGEGRYHALSIDDDDLRALGVLTPDAISAAGAAPADASVRRVLDQGYWLVLPLLALVLLAFRRGSGLACVAMVAVFPLLSPLSAQAQAPAATPWQRADQVAHAQMRDGAAAYREKRYEDALQAWADLPGIDAAYNRGNALARLGRFDEAIAAYDEALSQQPGMADALANRAAVEAARKRKPPPGPGEDPRAPQKPRDGDSQPKPGDAGDSSDSQAGDAQGQGDTPPPPEDAQPQESEAPPPADAQAQRDADAQQRERMQRALEGQPEAGDEAPASGAPNGDAGDEREQANAAWLRRVPDDPGGLLRAKFRLEHERRATGGDR